MWLLMIGSTEFFLFCGEGFIKLRRLEFKGLLYMSENVVNIVVVGLKSI